MTYPSPGILGGIETLMARMSRWLVRNGHEVTFLIRSNRAWADIIDKKVNCVALGDRYRELYYCYHAEKMVKSLNIGRPDVIKSFDISSSWIACQLSTMMADECKVIAGIYTPGTFSKDYSKNTLKQRSVRALWLKTYLEVIPADSRIYCGIDVIEELIDVHGKKGVLWPIPIDRTEFEHAFRRPQKGKIVSVGRLSPMKEYNFYMIDAVRQLLQNDCKVHWMVYGEGEYETEMRRIIRDYHLENDISIKGTVPYQKFWKVLENAYVFVGMGTSVLEAAMFQVPNIKALPYDRLGATFGSTCKLPKGSLSNSTRIKTEKKIADEIERILDLNETDYCEESRSVQQSISEHEIDNSMKHFLGIIKEAKPVMLAKRNMFKSYLYRIIREIS
jgi:glycosyltransferase involved in cell wall biosynthesis